MPSPTSTSRPTPRTINGTFVPAPHDRVASIEIEGETVLLDESTEALHALDPIGGIVWKCFDGSGSINEIVADLSAEFAVERKTVRKDVLRLTRHLGRLGVLEGVDYEYDRGEPITHDVELGTKKPRYLVVPPTS